MNRKLVLTYSLPMFSIKICHLFDQLGLWATIHNSWTRREKEKVSIEHLGHFRFSVCILLTSSSSTKKKKTKITLLAYIILTGYTSSQLLAQVL